MPLAAHSSGYLSRGAATLIGRFGEVRHSRLLGSTGDPQRDSALVESLRGVRVMQATPATLAQPLTILLLPKTTGKAMECKLTEGVGGS